MNLESLLAPLQRQPGWHPLDLHFARFLVRLATRPSAELALGAALASRSSREGEICVDLSTWSESLDVPPLENWQEALHASGVVGDGHTPTPLVLDRHHRLYLHRYWEYQHLLGLRLKERMNQPPEPLDRERLQEGLARLFPARSAGTDWQKVAVVTALLKRFCMITGGPGTGKTYTVVSLLVLLLEQNPGLRIQLAAPTGKAAARLQEVIQNTLPRLNCAETIKAALPREARTLHRLLGGTPDSVHFRHHEGNPLPVDLLVLDESSMVGVALMSRLVQALPPTARLVLLGDKDQLPPVEAGSILGEVCTSAPLFSTGHRDLVRSLSGEELEESPTAPATPGLRDVVVQLRHSRRFDPQRGIGALAEAVRRGDGATALALLREGNLAEIAWSETPSPDSLGERLAGEILHPYRGIGTSTTPEEALGCFEGFRILCAQREGPWGVHRVNDMVEGLLRPEDGPGVWYTGRPVMITRNDYDLGLFNGDIGMTWPNPEEEGALMVWFRGEDGRLRPIHPSRLPEHETAYAMTLHKSQGSEFEGILILLPGDPSRVMSQALIYTGLTRARERVTLWGREELFVQALHTPQHRASGLLELLVE